MRLDPSASASREKVCRVDPVELVKVKEEGVNTTLAAVSVTVKPVGGTMFS
jgi:hypothetical protein